MSVVEELRQVLQDFLTPELREIKGHLDSIGKLLEHQDKHLDTIEKGYDVRYLALSQRLNGIESANGVRYQAIMQRLEQIQQSLASDKRISNLEAEKSRTAW